MSISQSSQDINYVKKIVYWDSVERSGVEEYDEAYLATLRLEIKDIESEHVLIVPRRFSGEGSFWAYDKSEVMSEQTEEELFETFTASMVHVARRIKDCKNVVGFVYPDFEKEWEVLSHYSNEYKEKFMAAFQKKHSHYIFIE